MKNDHYFLWGLLSRNPNAKKKRKKKKKEKKKSNVNVLQRKKAANPHWRNFFMVYANVEHFLLLNDLNV